MQHRTRCRMVCFWEGPIQFDILSSHRFGSEGDTTVRHGWEKLQHRAVAISLRVSFHSGSFLWNLFIFFVWHTCLFTVYFSVFTLKFFLMPTSNRGEKETLLPCFRSLCSLPPCYSLAPMVSKVYRGAHLIMWHSAKNQLFWSFFTL